MNCAQAIEQMLKSSDPRRLDTDIQAHLSQCAQCASQAARMQALENDLVVFCASPTVPIMKDLEAKIASRLEFTPPAAPSVLKFRKPNMDRARQKLALAVALVAILFTVALGLFILPPSVDRDSLPGLVAHKDYQLSRAQSLPVRMQMVAAMVRQGRTEARLFSQQGDTRRMLLHASLLAALMEKDVEKLIVAVGGDLRERKGELAQELAYLESDCQRLAIQHASQAEASAVLLQLAVASKRAESRLRLGLES